MPGEDLGTGLPFEHGLHSTLVAMRLGERLGVDAATASRTYYACLLFYAGCTADAELSAQLFPDAAALATHFHPVMFGSRPDAGRARARAGRPGAPGAGARPAGRAAVPPTAVRGHERHVAALCEVAQMLTDRLGVPAGPEPVRGPHRALGRPR